MTRLTLITVLATGPAFAQQLSKEESCGYQADVVAAVQQARLDRVSERKVPEAVAATNPSWPESFNNAVPLIAPWVYEQKMKAIRTEDLGAIWREMCLKQP
ncbi:hypothetical protein [Aliisedimentitalea scapharcae]|uniref:hypothetical protein n=1 Tax=Aliisedimentitalea scapharcae TaxID=1524259 RepID=UPI003872AF15